MFFFLEESCYDFLLALECCIFGEWPLL